MDRNGIRGHSLSRRRALRFGAGAAGAAFLADAVESAPGLGIQYAWAQDGSVTVPDFTTEVEAKAVELELWTMIDTHARWFDTMAEAYAAQVNRYENRSSSTIHASSARVNPPATTNCVQTQRAQRNVLFMGRLLDLRRWPR